MTLNDVKRCFKREAELLGDYESMSKTDLANGYCDAEEAGNEILRSRYWGALMLRYWGWILKWKKESFSLNLEDLDFINWLNDSLADAFYYRGWRFEYKAVVRNGKFIEWKLDENGNKIPNPNYYLLDPNAPDKNINFFLGARRAKEYQATNKQVRKGNYQTLRLDTEVEENGDSVLQFAGLYTEGPKVSKVTSLIRDFIYSGKEVEALIIDGIANGDSFKESKTVQYKEDTEEKYYSYSSSFDPKRLVKYLNSINVDFMLNHFCKLYKVTEAEGLDLFSRLKSLNNKKLYKYIDDTLNDLRQNKDLITSLL